MKNKPMKIIIKLIVMVVISLFVFASFDLEDRFQYINNLDYNVTLNEDGSMNVTETWDINVNLTNTLFKNFKLSNVKYGDITDVKVVDLKTNTELTKIYEEMYHVTKGCYYALPIEGNKFEIAWGVGMDDEFGNRKYQISYKVNDVITKYNDFQEMYWQFLGKGENDVPVSKITGTVTLPQEVNNIENLRVWGHGQLNGKIEKLNKQKAYFEINNLRPKQMLEIRLAIEDDMFNVSQNKTRNYNYLNSAIREETRMV